MGAMTRNRVLFLVPCFCFLLIAERAHASGPWQYGVSTKVQRAVEVDNPTSNPPNAEKMIILPGLINSIVDAAPPNLSASCGAGSKVDGTNTMGLISLVASPGLGDCSVFFSVPYAKPPVCFLSSNRIHNHTIATSTLTTDFHMMSDDGFGDAPAYEEIQYVCFAR